MKKVVFALLTVFSFINLTFAAEIRVFAVGTLSYVIDELIKAYNQKYPNDTVKVTIGSAGKGYNQIINGAPYDIFLSADMEFPEKLKKQGFTISDVKPYAIGTPIIWTRKDSGIDLSKGINVVLDPNVKKIAIPNPDLALFGKAAKECLEYYKLWDKVKNKLVLAETVNQALAFADSKASEIAFLSLQLVKYEKVENTGNYYILPSECHSPVIFGYVLLKNASENSERLEAAKRFFNFIKSPEAKSIFKKYDFILPEDR